MTPSSSPRSSRPKPSSTKDRPLISSVIYNRLEIGQGLNIDAALVYAKGERGVPLAADREIDSLYNTYKYAGLVPTPISTIRRASLEAAADPADTELLLLRGRRLRRQPRVLHHPR